MTSPRTTLARPGDIVQIAEQDYLYGNAAVTVRITGIDPGLDHIRGLEWVRILAVDTDQPEAESRALLVRSTALRRPHTSTPTPTRRTPGTPAGFALGIASYGRLPSPRGRRPTNTAGVGEDSHRQGALVSRRDEGGQ